MFVSPRQTTANNCKTAFSLHVVESARDDLLVINVSSADLIPSETVGSLQGLYTVRRRLPGKLQVALQLPITDQLETTTEHITGFLSGNKCSSLYKVARRVHQSLSGHVPAHQRRLRQSPSALIVVRQDACNSP